MTDCLDDIQIEEALCGQADEWVTAHLSLCSACHRRLVEAQAIRTQLRAAFQQVHVPQNLVERITQMTVGQGCEAPAATAPRRGYPHRIPRWMHHWGRLTAAACLILGVSLVALWQWTQPASASAAQELVRLHEQNLSGHMELMHESHDQDEAFLSNKLGYKVAMPRDKGELRMKGCCVARFLGRQAGNMVIHGSNGPISVIVSDVNENELKTKANIVKDGRTFWVCPMKGFHTVAVRNGGLIYCAVGDETPENLVAILNDILNQHAE
jgi:hypothetical protein